MFESLRICALCLKAIGSLDEYKSFQQDLLQQIQTQINAISIPPEPKMVSFECDNSNIMEELSGLGKLIEKVVYIDYSCKLKPLLSMCEIGNAKEQLCNSHGLCVDNTNGNIYVADQLKLLNNCIMDLHHLKYVDLLHLFNDS